MYFSNQVNLNNLFCTSYILPHSTLSDQSEFKVCFFYIVPKICRNDEAAMVCSLVKLYATAKIVSDQFLM